MKCQYCGLEWVNECPQCPPAVESVKDFKARIAGIMRGSPPATIEPRKTGSSIVRLPADRGYYPPSREATR